MEMIILEKHFNKVVKINRTISDMIYDVSVITGRQGDIIVYDRMFNQQRIIIKKVDGVEYNTSGASQKRARDHVKKLFLQCMEWEEVK